jgi:hypothetical protein
MDFFLIVLLSVYIGIGLYEFYKSVLMGYQIIECLMNAVSWPVVAFVEIKDLIKRNYIDREGP